MHSTCGPNGGNTNTEFDALLLARAAATITITKISHSYHFLSASCSITDKYFCQLLAESHSAVWLSVVLKCRHFFRTRIVCVCFLTIFLTAFMSNISGVFWLIVSTTYCARVTDSNQHNNNTWRHTHTWKTPERATPAARTSHNATQHITHLPGFTHQKTHFVITIQLVHFSFRATNYFINKIWIQQLHLMWLPAVHYLEMIAPSAESSKTTAEITTRKPSKWF